MLRSGAQSDILCISVSNGAFGLQLVDIFLVHGAGRTVNDPTIRNLGALLSDSFQPRPLDMGSGAVEPKHWMDTLSVHLGSMGGNDVLIGHSLGASQILKWLAEHKPAQLPKAVFALACPFWGAKDWNADEYRLSPNSAAVLSRIDLISFWQGGDDSTVPPAHLERYRDLVPFAEFSLLPGIRHDFDRASLELVANRVRQIAGAQA